MTTDFRDFRDVNHERKREIPSICAICVQTKITFKIITVR